jgi:S-formylglutathione hydrolase FrmB
MNSPTFGAFSDYLCDEIVPFVESKFSCGGSSAHRAVLGHSSGGYGALLNGFQRSDIFSAVGSSAGDSWFEISLLPLVKTAVIEFEKAGGPEKFIQKFLEDPNPMGLPRARGETMMLLCMMACYAPNKNRPLFCDPFFDLNSGTIDENQWKKILQHDPLYWIPKMVRNNSNLPRYISLDAGTSDEYGLQLGHRQIAKILEGSNIKVDLEEYPGGHSGTSWRYAQRISKLVNAMNS